MYRIYVELVLDKPTLHFVSLYKMNLPEITITAIKNEIARKNDISGLIQLENPYEELRTLRQEIIRLREEKLTEPRQQQKKRLFARISGGGE